MSFHTDCKGNCILLLKIFENTFTKCVIDEGGMLIILFPKNEFFLSHYQCLAWFSALYGHILKNQSTSLVPKELNLFPLFPVH